MGDDYEDEYCRFIEDYPEPAPTREPPQKPLWVVHMAHQGVGATLALADNFVCFGWNDVGDLRRLENQKNIRAYFAEFYAEKSKATLTRWANEAHRFVFEMKEADVVVHPIEDADDVMIGTVSGPYRFEGHHSPLFMCDSANVVPVKWLARVPRTALSDDARSTFGRPFTVRDHKQHRAEIVKLIEHLGVT